MKNSILTTLLSISLLSHSMPLEARLSRGAKLAVAFGAGVAMVPCS